MKMQAAMIGPSLASRRFNVVLDGFYFNLPIVDQSINSLLSQLPSVLVLVVVIAPAEDHQTFTLGLPDVGEVL